MPRVSVIMPAYNVDRYIEEAIESVLSQVMTDWELIVVDDGSTDSTFDILDKLAHPRIFIIRQKNQGPATARNAGLDMAQGEYIAFLDADDLYLNSALADLVEYLDGHLNFDVVYSDGIICDQDKHPLMRLSEQRPGFYTGRILEHVVLSSDVIAVPICTLTRRAIIKANGLRFDKDLNGMEDSFFWIQTARYARFGYLDKITCMYRVHQTNISRTTGRIARRKIQILARSKIMNSKWFNDLSSETRKWFFHHLLTTLLAGQPGCQFEIMASFPFRDLPLKQQAHLYRMVANSHLMQGEGAEIAERCLEQSLVLCPDDRRSQVLLSLLKMSPSLCTLTLLTWQKASQACKSLRTVGQRKPKPVPAALSQSFVRQNEG